MAGTDFNGAAGPLASARFILSVDPGKRHDPFSMELFRATPIDAPPGRGGETLDWLRSRKGLDMRYTDFADMVAEASRSGPLDGDCAVLLDATGVGETVRDLLEDRGVATLPIVFTSGNQAHWSWGSPASAGRFAGGSPPLRRLTGVSVPKQDMVHAAQVLLQQGRLRISQEIPPRDRADIRAQLLDFSGRVNERGRLLAEAAHDSVHDDHVAALLMAAWFHMARRGARDGGSPPPVGGAGAPYSPMAHITDGRGVWYNH